MSILVNFLNNCFFEHFISGLLGSNDFLDLVSKEFIVIQLIFLVLASYELEIRLGRFVLQLSHTVGIFCIISNFLNSASFVAKFLIALRLDLIKLF